MGVISPSGVSRMIPIACACWSKRELHDGDEWECDGWDDESGEEVEDEADDERDKLKLLVPGDMGVVVSEFSVVDRRLSWAGVSGMTTGELMI